MLRTGLFLLESAFSGVFLWLGLYLVTRDTPIHVHHDQRWWQRSALAIGMAFMCVAVYLLCVAMTMIVDDPEKVVFWWRLTTLATPPAAALFFCGLFLVTTQEERSPRSHMFGHVVCLLLLAYAICIAIVGATTNLFFQFDVVQRILRPPYYLAVPPRYPFYVLHVAMIVGTLLVGTFLILRRSSAVEGATRRQLQWLGLAAASATLGATIGFAGVGFPRVDQYLPAELSDALLIVGLFATGHSIARYNALFQNRTITRDFYRSLAGVVVTSIAFGLVFKGVHSLTRTPLTPESTPLLIWLATLTLTSRPWVSERLDYIFFDRPVARTRSELEQAIKEIATAEDEEQVVRKVAEVPAIYDEEVLEEKLKDIKKCIKKEINTLLSKTNYQHDSNIWQSPLLKLAIVEEKATALMQKEGVSPTIDRDPYLVRAFREIISGLVADMNPDTSSKDGKSAEPPNLSLKEQEMQYIILKQQFVDQKERGKYMKKVKGTVHMALWEELGVWVSESVYTRSQQVAKDRLADRLYLAERKVIERQVRRSNMPETPESIT